MINVNVPATQEAANAIPRLIALSSTEGSIVFISIKKVYTIYMSWYNQFHPEKKKIQIGIQIGICFILTVILLYNLILSQMISPLYSKFIQNEKNTIGSVLRSIQKLPEFDKLYLVYKNKYGTRIEGEVFEEQKKDALFIFNLESALKQSPESRDVSFNLSQILKKTGEDGKRYFMQAKQIDPEIN